MDKSNEIEELKNQVELLRSEVYRLKARYNELLSFVRNILVRFKRIKKSTKETATMAAGFADFTEEGLVDMKEESL